jgi:antitoxin component HigA of HigAB toxin-antitoxin module
LTEKPEAKRLMEKPKSSWENIKVYLKRYRMKRCGLGPVVGSVNTITNVRDHEIREIASLAEKLLRTKK